MTRQGLTAALIVRDEAEHLPECIAALRTLGPVLQDIVVLDTGSLDGSAEVARTEGCRVGQMRWGGDFAAARNTAMSMATTEWVLNVDADERVEAGPDVGRLLRDAADSTDAYVVSLVNVDEWGNEVSRVRLARLLRRSRVTWVGEVHEQPRRTVGGAAVLVDVSPDVLAFRHIGYASAARRMLKAARNELVADEAVARLEADGPSEDLARALLHRGRSRTMIKPDAAEADFRRASGMGQPGAGVCERAGDNLVQLLTDAGRIEEAVVLVGDGHARGVGQARVAWWLVAVLAAAGQPDDALRLLTYIHPGSSPTAPTHDDVAKAEIRLLRLTTRSDEALAAAILHAARGADVHDDLRQLWGEQDRATLAKLLLDAGARDADQLAFAILGAASWEDTSQV